MPRLLKTKSRPVGLPPGSLLFTGEGEIEKVRISILEYNEDEVLQKEAVTIEECLKYIETPSMTWIQVYGVTNPAMVAAIGKHFKLHSLVLEDIVNTNQRSKMD